MRAEASNNIRRLHHHAVRTDDMEATPAILRGHSRNAHQHVIGTPRTYDMAGRLLLGREPAPLALLNVSPSEIGQLLQPRTRLQQPDIMRRIEAFRPRQPPEWPDNRVR
jgi:hypothetical protein